MKRQEENHSEETGAYDDAVLQAEGVPPVELDTEALREEHHPDSPPKLDATAFLDAYYRNQQ